MHEGAKHPIGAGAAVPVESVLTRRPGRWDGRGLVLGLAMALTVVAGLAMAVRDGDRVKSLDEPAYFDLGSNLAFQFAFAHTNSPDIEGFDARLPIGELRPTAYRAPGYAWLQAPFRRLGGYPLLRAVNFVLLALTLWTLHGLLVRRAGPLGGLFGLGLAGLYPVLFYAAGVLYPQTMAALLLVASLSLLDRLERASRLRRFVLAGLTWGTLILTIPICLLLVPIVAAWMIGARRARPAQLAVTLVAIAAVTGPWVVRNSLVLGAPHIATSSGFNLLVGNGPYIRYDQTTASLRWPPGVRDQVAGKGEVERDRIMARAALWWMQENPREAATLYLQKLLYWFAFRNQLVSDRLVFGGSAAGPPWLRDLVMFLGYGLLLGILLLRLALVRRHPLSALEVLLLLLYLGAGMAYAIYFTRIRFRLPFDWLMITVDAMFLARLLRTDEGGATTTVTSRPPPLPTSR